MNAFAPLTPEELAAADGSGRFHPPADDRVPIVPVPNDASPLRFRHPLHGEPSRTWPYFDADGRLVCHVGRFDFTDDGGEACKDYRPLTWCRLKDGRRAWRAKGLDEPRPLYRLPQILADPSRPVLVVEGEKAADAAAALFPAHAVTTAMHGARSPGRTDWTSLKGREVVVWPDNDGPGLLFARKVAELALDAGALSVRVVRLPESLPPGWDLADAAPDGLDRSALLAAAVPWVPPEVPAIERAGEVQGGFLLLKATVAAEGDAFGGGTNEPGVYRKVRRRVPGTDEEAEEWRRFASPIEVRAISRDDVDEHWGLLVEVIDFTGGAHRWAMPRAMLAGSGEELRKILFHLGLWLESSPAACAALTKYLNNWRPERQARCVEATGWHKRVFVLPERVVGDAKGEEVVLQVMGGAPRHVLAGSLDTWREGVARLCAGNARLVLAVCAAFAGPLLRPLGEEPGGFHFRGGSSSGKTTALRVAASVWGTPLGSWRITDNAAESAARAANDALLCLDEIGQADGRAVDALAYMLANGQGKARMTRDGLPRDVIGWRLVFLSTGETGLGEKMHEAGRRARAGQEVRVVDLPADAGRGLGLFEALHGEAGGDAFAKRLKVAAEASQGHPARAFVARLADDLDEAVAAIKPYRARWLEAHVPSGADGQVRRVADRFALVAAAGELATDYGLTGWREGEAAAAAARCFADWLDARGGTEPLEVRQGIAQVRAFLELHGESRFDPAWEDERARTERGHERDRPTLQRVGFRKREGDGWDYYVLSEGWKNEVCKGLDPGMVARALAERGWLVRGEGTKLQVKPRVPGQGSHRLYHLKGSLLSG